MNKYWITALSTKDNLKMQVSFPILAKSIKSAYDLALQSWKEDCTSKLEIIGIIKGNIK